MNKKMKIIELKMVNQDMFYMPWSIYPYSNYLKYGCGKDFFKLYLVNNCIFTQYHDSVQICSKTIDNDEAFEISNFINIENIRMVSGAKNVIESIFNRLGRGRIENGLIFELKEFDINLGDANIRLVNETGVFYEIAKLVCESNSSNTSFYGLEQYRDQILNRYKEGYCRNWIYTINHQVIGHIATYAETPKYCVLGGLAVDAHFRGQGIAKKLLSYSIMNIGRQKKVYAFCFNHNLEPFYKRISIGFWETSKLLLK